MKKIFFELKDILRRMGPIYGFLSKIYYFLFPRRYYNFDLRRSNRTPISKTALLSYIVNPFLMNKDEERYFMHINNWRAVEMVKVLNEAGYMVDVIHYNDMKFKPQKKYDLFIGHGGYGNINFIKVAKQLPKDTIKIYFSTTAYWDEYNISCSNRYKDLSKRKGTKIKFNPPFTLVQDNAISLSDGIIGIGGDYTRQTYKNFKQVVMINNTALKDDYFIKRDFKGGRNNFLFFAGAGNINKGLDLILEIFSNINQHLWICTSIDEIICQIFSDELNHHQNIHLIGNIFPRSEIFYDVIRKCNFVILPSCSEGQPHSIIECMKYGLIPIVSRSCSIDVDSFGEYINHLDVDEIKNIIRKCSIYSPERCQAMSNKVIKEVKANYTEERFRENLSSALKYFCA